jgi:hypothetical protein
MRTLGLDKLQRCEGSLRAPALVRNVALNEKKLEIYPRADFRKGYRLGVAIAGLRRKTQTS